MIAPQDLLIRTTSIGAEETYEVVDPVFYEQHGSIAAHYQIRVRKLGLPEARQHAQNITYNVSGAGARVNHNSVDNSVNTILIDSEVQGNLDTIREAIENANLTPSDRDEALEVVKELKDQFDSGKPKKTIVTALLGALPSIVTITKAVSALAAAVRFRCCGLSSDLRTTDL